MANENAVQKAVADAILSMRPGRDLDQFTLDEADLYLDAIPDGWAKVDGEWIQVEPTEWSGHQRPDGSWGRMHDKNSVHMDGCHPVYVRVW